MRLSEADYDALIANRGKRQSAQSPAIAQTKCPIRQQRKGKQPNSTERRFELAYLKVWQHEGGIISYEFEKTALELANGLKYTPDWEVLDAKGRTICYEVKGAHIREDAIVKLKMAAARFPDRKFFLAQWKKGEWRIWEVFA